MHLVCYLWTVEVSLIDHMCVCVCVTQHRCQLTGSDPGGLLLGRLSNPEQKLELGVRGRTQQRRRVYQNYRNGREEEVTRNGEKRILLWIRGRYKGRKSGGEKSGYTETILSCRRIHGNLPTSAFWTALQTERQQMVYIGVIFDIHVQFYFWIYVRLRYHHQRHPEGSLQLRRC